MHHEFKCKIWHAMKEEKIFTTKRIPKFDTKHEMGKQNTCT